MWIDSPRSLKGQLSATRNQIATVIDLATIRFRPADVAFFHQFQPAPAGGGHQFLRGLWRELARRGLRLESNTISRTTRACLCNSYNFDLSRLRAFRREGCRIVHRIDGPISVYRGREDAIDRRIWEINQELADATIFQSAYSLDKHLELGLEFKSPCVILNAADPELFHPRGRVPFDRKRKIRLISSSWSDNPHKGAAVHSWLEQHLDWDRFEYTFVGRSPEHFKRIRVQPPLPSQELAGVLRQHDIFVFASQNDSCSNSLIEALSCGLPAIYLRSGGSPEIVGDAGLAFATPEEIPALLEQVAEEYESRQNRISVPSIAEVADRYLDIMGMAAR